MSIIQAAQLMDKIDRLCELGDALADAVEAEWFEYDDMGDRDYAGCRFCSLSRKVPDGITPQGIRDIIEAHYPHDADCLVVKARAWRAARKETP